MIRFAPLSALALALAMAIAPLTAQQIQSTEQWRAKFEHEADPVHKAKLLLSLGDSEFKDAESALANDKNDEALDILKNI